MTRLAMAPGLYVDPQTGRRYEVEADGGVRWADVPGVWMGWRLELHEGDASPCWVCGAPGRWIDWVFDAFVCGGICAWAGTEALRLHDTPFRAWL